MDDGARPNEHVRILGHGGNGFPCRIGAEGDLRDRQPTRIQRLAERNGIGGVVHYDDGDDAPPEDLGRRGRAWSDSLRHRPSQPPSTGSTMPST